MARNKFDVDERLESPFRWKHLKRAGKYIVRHKYKMLAALLMSALASIASLFIPKITQWVLDEAVPSGDSAMIGRMALLFVGIIAQRISSMRDADLILVLRDGKISESGTHKELLEKRGYYWQTYCLQYGLPMEDREFVARLDEIPFDLLHLHSPFQSWTVAKHVLKTRPVPLVTTFHSKYYDDFLKATHSKMITNAVVRKIVNVYRRCDEVWTVNSSTADVLRGYGFDGAITVVSNGTDLVAAGEAEVDTVRRKYGVREGCPVFLYVGQIDCKKNLPMTLEACALLKER